MGFSIIDLSFRGVNFIFFVIILGLTGSLIHGQDHTNARVNFALFTAVFGLVTSSFYGALAQFIEFLAWPLITIVLEFLNFVFTFAAACALAVGLRVHSCTNQDYLDNNAIAQGSSDRCRKGQAATAFLFFAFAVTIVTFAFASFNLANGGPFSSFTRSSRPRAGGIPTISTA